VNNKCIDDEISAKDYLKDELRLN